MADIKKIKISSTTYDIAAIKDADGNIITDTYATKTDIGNISSALDAIIAQTEAIIGHQYYAAAVEEASEEEEESVNE